jgi:glycosyltransferase involved in cell wall biosynthesis
MMIFSVIIPHYNDEKRLVDCLKSLYNQDYPVDQIEVLVVDDCSPVDIGHHITALFPQLRFFSLEKNSGPAAARNLGIKNACGTYLAFVDCDALVGSLWLQTFEKEFQHGEKIVCGPVFHRNCLLGQITAITAFGDFLDLKDGYRPNCPGVNYAIRTDVMKHFSYDESLGLTGKKVMPQCEDLLICTQFVSAGLRIRYVVDAWVLHDPSLTASKFSRRAFLYGVGFAASRSRESSLPGFWLHKNLKGASCIPLFGIRLAFDVMRLIKHRKILKINLFGLVPSLVCIFWVRIMYAYGVFEGYRK